MSLWKPRIFVVPLALLGRWPPKASPGAMVFHLRAGGELSQTEGPTGQSMLFACRLAHSRMFGCKMVLAWANPRGRRQDDRKCSFNSVCDVDCICALPPAQHVRRTPWLFSRDVA